MKGKEGRGEWRVGAGKERKGGEEREGRGKSCVMAVEGWTPLFKIS